MSNNKRSDDTTPEEFDHINSINYRGCWLSSRAAIKQMLTQEPLPSHDGRPGIRGSVVNVASQLGIVGRPAARKSLYRGAASRRKRATLTYLPYSRLLWLQSSSYKHGALNEGYNPISWCRSRVRTLLSTAGRAVRL